MGGMYSTSHLDDVYRKCDRPRSRNGCIALGKTGREPALGLPNFRDRTGRDGTILEYMRT